MDALHFVGQVRRRLSFRPRRQDTRPRSCGGDRRRVLGQIALAVLTISCGFADHLYQGGLYGAAATEYAREIYEAGDTLSAPVSALRLARCWQETGQPERALGMYLFLGERLGPGAERGLARMGAGSVYETVGMLHDARGSYAAAAEDLAGYPVLHEENLALAALSLGRSGNWPGAALELDVLAGGDASSTASRLASVARRAADPPARSRLLCGLSSALLPGSGQAVCGHWTDALTSFIMTAGTGALLVAALEEEDTPASVLFGWLALSFYGGNVYGGARAAARWNAARTGEIMAEVPGLLLQYRLAAEDPLLPPE